MFSIKKQSVFDTKVDAYVNTINCVGVMGAGIAREFKERFPDMFSDYKDKCKQKLIKPGECYVYKHDDCYILGAAVKDDWKLWATKEWIVESIESVKQVIINNPIKSINLPVFGGMNGRRGSGVPSGFTPPPSFDSIVGLMENQLKIFSNHNNINITLCIPTLNNKTENPNISEFQRLYKKYEH